VGSGDSDEAAQARLVSAGVTRLAWGAVALSSLGVLAVARVLVPDPSGMGTHEQLGLPPCGFHFLTGLPCPACGLTTSFAHMARLQITEAFRAHAIGVLLFALTALAVPLALTACLRGWPIAETMGRLAVGRAALWMLGLLIVAWIVRLAAQLV
jgi:hypothetical protein